MADFNRSLMGTVGGLVLAGIVGLSGIAQSTTPSPHSEGKKHEKTSSKKKNKESNPVSTTKKK